MFTLLLLSALGKTELFFFLFLIALVVGYLIGRFGSVTAIYRHIETQLVSDFEIEKNLLHDKVQSEITTFESRYCLLVASANKDVKDWEKDLRGSIARSLLALRTVVAIHFGRTLPQLDRKAAETQSAGLAIKDNTLVVVDQVPQTNVVP